MSASVDALSRVLLPVLEHAARGQGDAPGVAFSWLSASMAAAAEISQVSALCVLSTYIHPWSDPLDLMDGTDHGSQLGASMPAAAQIAQVNAMSVLSKTSDEHYQSFPVTYFSWPPQQASARKSLWHPLLPHSFIVPVCARRSVSRSFRSGRAGARAWAAGLQSCA